MRRPDDLTETTEPNEPPPTPHRHAERLPAWATLTIGALGLGMAALGLLLWVTRSTSSADIQNLENRLAELCTAGDVRAACQDLPPTIIVTPATGATIQPPATATSAPQRLQPTSTTVGSSRPSSTAQATTAPPSSPASSTAPPSSTTAPPPSSTSTTRRTIVPTLPSIPVGAKGRPARADVELPLIALGLLVVLLVIIPRRPRH